MDLSQLSGELNIFLKEREELLTKEKIVIDSQISNLKSSNSLGKLICWYQKRKLNNRRNILKFKFEEEKSRPFKKLIDRTKSLQEEISDKTNNTERWTDLLSEEEINRIELIKSTLETNKYILYGAKGEESAVDELKKLPDSYVVINNFQQHFSKPIHDKKNDDWIYSVQIDHIVLGPTGLFFIETKNWSQDSIENQDFFSPVKQIRRSNYAMFCVLNQAIQKNELDYFTGGWGDKKISPRNLLLFMNHKPPKEFQFVKILSINEIRSYITYGDVIFSEDEVETLTDYINKINQSIPRKIDSE